MCDIIKKMQEKAGVVMATRRNVAAQQEKVQKGRNRSVYKQDGMIQKSRIPLSLREQKCVLYAISKISPNDQEFGTYTFDLKEFYALCGLNGESYTDLKAVLKKLADKSWWGEDPNNPDQERLYRWFNDIVPNKKDGTLTIEFHKNMIPFLLQVAGNNTFYTSYNLKYVLPMKSQYAPRLYEILKSYQKNNVRWYFEIDELKKHLDCQGYKNFKDFRRRVLEPSVEEINKYTDINIAYKTELTGNKVTRIVFGMISKTKSELLEAEKNGAKELDGQVNLFELLDDVREDPLNKLFGDHVAKVRTESGQ